jgi:hypothetical protein
MPPKYNMWGERLTPRSRSPSPTPEPLRLSLRIALGFPDGRNQVREEFFNSMYSLRGRRLPKDVLEIIWRFWLRNRSIPFFPLYYRRQS